MEIYVKLNVILGKLILIRYVKIVNIPVKHVQVNYIHVIHVLQILPHFYIKINV
jgi:hypothetical protein